MVKITGTHRVSIDRLVIIGTAPQPAVSMQLESSSVSEASLTGTAVVAELDEASYNAIVVPFTLSGTATRVVDYELRISNHFTAPIIAALEFRFAPGQTTAAIHVVPTTFEDAVEPTETIILTFDAVDEDALYTVDALDTHTVYLEDASPAADPIITFMTSGETISEGADGETTAVVILAQLSRSADGGETNDFTIGGTAAGGDFSTAPASLTMTWDEGQDSQEIRHTVIGDDDINALQERTIITTLTNPSDLTLGTLIVHTTKIIDDDAVVLSTQVSWRDTEVTVNEGAGLVQFPIDLVIGESAGAGIFLTATIGTSTATPGLNYEIGNQVAHIPAGQTATDMAFSFPLNLLEPHVDTELVLILSAGTGLVAGSTTLTITIKNTTNAELPIDGILIGYDDGPLAPERVQFNVLTPDILMYRDGVQVIGNNGITADWYYIGAYGSDDYDSQALMDLALYHADLQWAANNPLVVDRSAVLMGEEHNLVTIKCYGMDRAGSNVGQLGGHAGDKSFDFNIEASNSWSVIQTDCILYPNTSPQAVPCIRDLVFFGAVPGVPTLFAGLDFRHNTGLVDNIRFENLRMSARSYVKTPFFVSSEKVGGTANGRIKLYDCSGKNEANVTTGLYDWGTSEHRRASKWGLRAEGRAAWDIRVADNAPFPFADSNEEHYLYIDSPVGDTTYPAMLTTAQAQGQTRAGNYFIGITGNPDEPPGRTAIQIASRRTSNPGDIGSGDLNFIRCVGRNIGSEIVSGGQGFSIWGHGGRVYFKDCAYLLSAPYERSFGGLGLLSEVSWANGDLLPHGQEAIESGGTGYLYQIAEVVVDGFTYNVSSQGNGSRAAMKFFGVQTLRLIKFDLLSGTLTVPGNWKQLNMNDRGFAGLGFTETFDITNLVYPDGHAQEGDAYTDDFYDYPGWNGNATITDGYFMNWSSDTSSSGDGAIPMDEDAIDNYPAIVADQKAKRLTTADLSSTGFWPAGEKQNPNPQDFPNPRMKTGTTYLADIVDDVGTVRIDMKYGFMCELRVYHSESGSHSGAGGSFDYVAGSASPIVLTPPQLVSDVWEAANDGDGDVLSYYDMQVKITGIVSGGPTSSTTIIIDLADGGPDADYEFPKGSGTRVNVSGVSPLSRTIQVVPIGGMWSMQFAQSSVNAPYPAAGDFVAVTVTRSDLNSNADGVQFATVFGITGAFTGKCISGLFYDLNDSGSVDVYTPATSFTFEIGAVEKTFYIGGLVDALLGAQTLIGYANLTITADDAYGKLGPITTVLVTMNDF